MWQLGFADAPELKKPSAISGAPASEGSPGGPGAPGAPGSVGAEVEQEQDDVKKEVGAVVNDLLPWGVSVVLHAAVVLLAIFIAWQTIVTQLEDDEIIVPTAKFSPDPGAPFTMQTTQKITQEASAAKRTVTKSENVTAANVAKEKAPLQLIGIAGGDSGKANPFGTGIAGDGMGANFYGTPGGNARRIAYVVDASGSLIDTLPFVIIELKRSISELVDAQSFAVLFFQDDRIVEVPPPGLKRATPEQKEQVNRWIDLKAGNISPMGVTSPVAAIKRALSYNPQLMFLLSDNITGRGKYEIQQDRLLKEIEQANRGGTKINTIQFLYPDPLENPKADRKGTLQLIAERSNGLYKFVDAAELGIR